MAQSRYDIEGTDFSTFDKLHPLVRSNSLERKCDECSYVARNEAKLDKHKEVTHVYTCDICKIPYHKYHGDKTLILHKEFVHENSDKIFTDEEFNQLDDDQKFEIKHGPETVRKASLIERIQEQEQKKKEEERRKRREKI